MSPSIPARGLLGLIQLYKWTLSPLIGRECRYLPTCSSYAAEAVRTHGAWAGSWMATARLCRCHPWGGSGWDPAPELKPRAPWYAPWTYGDWRGGYRAPADSFSLAEKVAAERPDEGRADAQAPVCWHAPHPLPPPRKGEGDAN